MAYLIWFVLLCLVIIFYITDPNFLWIPLIGYLIVVITRAVQKIGDHNDWLEKHRRDEKLKLEETATNLADRNLAFGGTRIKEERKIKEDFLYECRKKKRHFFVKLMDSLFLK